MTLHILGVSSANKKLRIDKFRIARDSRTNRLLGNRQPIKSPVLTTALLTRIPRVSFRKCWILDGPSNAERKGQLAVFQCGSRQTHESVGEEALLRSDLSETAIIEFVRTG